MNKIKFLYFIIGLLVVSNIILLIFFLDNRSNSFHPNKPRNIVIERLHFDKEQIQRYDSFIRNHRKKSRELGHQIQELKKELYSYLVENQNDSAVFNLISKISKKQGEFELVHYNHFLEIKSICTPAQMPLFKKMSKELLDIFPMGNNHRHKRIE